MHESVYKVLFILFASLCLLASMIGFNQSYIGRFNTEMEATVIHKGINADSSALEYFAIYQLEPPHRHFVKKIVLSEEDWRALKMFNSSKLSVNELELYDSNFIKFLDVAFYLSINILFLCAAFFFVYIYRSPNDSRKNLSRASPI